MVQMKKLLAWYEGTLEEKGLYDRVRMLEKACEVLAGRAPFFAGKTVGVLLDCDYTALEKQFIELLTGGLYTEVVSDTAEVSHIFYESYGMANQCHFFIPA
jgi:hypothetical protein